MRTGWWLPASVARSTLTVVRGAKRMLLRQPVSTQALKER
jgi:hypothetical protein